MIRSSFPRWPLVLVALLALPQERFENVEFTPPPGWNIRREALLIELAPTDARPQEVLRVLILRARPTTSDHGRDLETSWEDVRQALHAQHMMNPSRQIYDVDPTVSRTLHGWEYVKGVGGLRRPEGTYSVTVYVIRAGDRAERVAVIARDFNDNLTRTHAAMRPSYDRAIRRMIFTMRFANRPDRPSAPARLAGGSIGGVWAGLGMSSGRIRGQYAAFFDNGAAFYGSVFPEQGLDGIEPAVVQPAAPRYWGSYAATGDGGTITMSYASIPMRKSGTVLELTTNRTKHRFVRLEMPANGRLEGNFCLSGGACLRFDATGRFQDGGAVRVIEHATYPFHESPASGEGRYEIRNHTLVLKYTSGPELRVAYLGSLDGRGSSPAEVRVGFNADVLARR